MPEGLYRREYFLHELLLRHASSQPDAPAVVTSTGSWSYGQLERFVRRLALTLSQSGFARQRIVAIAAVSPEAIALLAACSMTGAVFVPLAPDTPPQRLRHMVEEIDPACIVCGPSVETLVESGAIPVGRLTVDGLEFPDAVERPHVESAGRIVDRDPAWIVFTSGSSGKPKGVVLSHGSAVAFLQGLIDFYGLDRGERYASMSPLHFDYCLLDIGLCLGSGATLVLPNRLGVFKPKALIQELVRLEVDHFSGVPSIWRILDRFAPREIAALQRLRRIAFAGEHFPTHLIGALYERLPNVEFVNIYGHSESIACTFTVLPRPLPPDCRYLPVGVGHPQLELILVDESDRRITTPLVPGELLLRGNLLFSGYWNDPEETRRRLTPDPFRARENGTVFRSGDICYFDEAGVFYLMGRKDEQVKILGNRVEPEEIERVLATHSGVGDCCVVYAGSGDRGGLHAFVVSRSPVNGEFRAELRSHCSSLLPAYMLPRDFHIVTRLPMLSSGKYDRKALLAGLEQGTE